MTPTPRDLAEEFMLAHPVSMCIYSESLGRPMPVTELQEDLTALLLRVRSDALEEAVSPGCNSSRPCACCVRILSLKARP